MPDDNDPKRVEPNNLKTMTQTEINRFRSYPVDKSFYTKHSDQAYQSESKRGFRCE